MPIDEGELPRRLYPAAGATVSRPSARPLPDWTKVREDRRRDAILSSYEEPPPGAHLVSSSRRLYRHHGIYVGRGRVIHYSGFAYG